MILRPYQDKGVNSVISLIEGGAKRVVLYGPTGSGKTEQGMAIIKKYKDLGKKIMFVCNRIELVKQTSTRISESGIEHGIIQGSNTCMQWEPVQVCSIQTLHKRGYPPADILLIDEAHCTPGSEAYRKLMQHHKDTPIVGLTATPFARGMSKKYDWGVLWEHLEIVVSIRELIEQGHLVDCDIYAPGEPDLSKVAVVAGDYHEGQLGKAVDKQELIGDIVEHWLKLAGGKPTVVFATNIAHSKHICEQFMSHGITAEHIDCYTCAGERKEILDRVTSGVTKVISNVAVLAEGWDFPACEIMILARPTRSLIRYIQMAGRILRPAPGKEKATILDHSGTCRRLGFPTDDLPLTLDDGSPRSKDQQKKEEKERSEKLPIVCKRCKKLMARNHDICPNCGYVRIKKSHGVKQVDGELVSLKRSKNSSDKNTEDGKRRAYAELAGYAQIKGYKPGWAWYRFRELFKEEPKEYAPSPIKPSEETMNLIKYLNIRYAKGRSKTA